MFARVKKTGEYQYLQIVENKKHKGKVKQRVIATIGRLDHLQEKNRVETLMRSLARYSENVLLILSGKSDVSAESKSIGPMLLFDRIWHELGIAEVIRSILRNRKYEFDVERAIFLTVLHRLMESGSDRSCDKWRRDQTIDGIDSLKLHHLYRAMAFLGEVLPDQSDATPFTPRCNKDIVEEKLFARHRNLFSNLNLVFFDTTSLYFEGQGGETLGKRGFNKDHRPDLRQMIVGVVLADHGQPICCEMWPGNTTDVNTLVPVIARLRKRFEIRQCCIVADRGMISKATLKKLEDPQTGQMYILGVRMRKVKEVLVDVLSRAGRFKEVHPYSEAIKDPAPLMVKEVRVNDTRYIVCKNEKQAFADINNRNAVIDSLKENLKQGPKSLIGNKGYRKYLKIEKDSVSINYDKITQEACFDGKWVLRTNTDLPADEVALKYKELWLIERVFRDMKSILDTRAIYHKRDETIRGHVFCSFLAIVLRKELERRLEKKGLSFEWEDIKRDLKALQEVNLEENDKRFIIRSQCVGSCGKVMQAVGVSPPPTIREVL